MATTEERLAALEAKLAALTATTPTEYYTHQYSGEEIDAAVGRALTGGALDTSVTNVSNQLGTFVRPNLLDNWYFGRPVDQRGGKIIQQGVNIYTDSTLKTLIGPAAYACPVVELTSTYAKVRDAKSAGSYYYAAPGDVVRGYTSNGYTVDRWNMAIDIGTVTVENDGIVLDGGSTGCTLYELQEPALLSVIGGQTLTWSAMYTILSQTGSPGSIGSTVPGSYVARCIFGGSVAVKNVASGSAVMPTNAQSASWFYIPIGCKIKIHAVKVELGPTQTLAHQENGVWVLNEVPDYGEQLRRCQRYYLGDMQRDAYGRVENTTNAYVAIPIPVTMRKSSGNPSLVFSRLGSIKNYNGAESAVVSVNCVVEADSYLLLNVVAKNLTNGVCVLKDTYFSVSKDL